MTRSDAGPFSPPARSAHRRLCAGHVIPVLSGVVLSLHCGYAIALDPQGNSDTPQRLKLALALEQLRGDGAAASRTLPRLGSDALETAQPALLRLSQRLEVARLDTTPPASAAPSGADGTQAPAAPVAPNQRPEPIGLPSPRTDGGATSRPQSNDARKSEPNSPESDDQTSTISAQVVGDAEFLPADEEDIDLPTAPLNRPQQPAPELTAQQGSERTRRRWGIPPIRWGGSVSVGLRQSTNDNGNSSTNQVYTGQLRASSYVLKPYIALVSGDFSLTSIRSRSGESDAASNNLIGTSITGSGSINVFPQSRFPFQASISLSDSRSEGSFNDSNTESKRLALRQDYRPPVGEWTLSTGYDRSMLTGDFGTDTVDRLYGQLNSRLDRHSFNLAADLTHSQWENGTFDAFYTTASHSVGYDSGLSITNFASLVAQRSRSETEDGVGLNSRVGSMQLYSAASWYPRDSKLRGTGTLRYFRIDNDSGALSGPTQTLAADINAGYQVNENFNLSGGIGFISDLEGDSRFQQNGNLGANYAGDPIRLGEFTYTWSTSASLGNNYGSDGRSAQSLGASIGHSLSRYWSFTEGTVLNLQLGQNVGSGRSFGGNDTVSPTTLSSNASLSLSANSGSSLNGYLSASFSDSRTRGETESTFQLLNLQLSGNWRINGWSSLNSNLTWQASRQESSSNEPIAITDEFGRLILIDNSRRTENYSLSGSAGYSNSRFMGIRRLGYRLDFRANTGGSRTSRRFGDPDGLRPEDEATVDLEQSLMYRIGRLDTELQHRITEVQGRRNQSIFVRATRAFGGF